MWDVDTGSAVGKPFEGHTSRVISIACSPNGLHIISGSTDTTIRLWDAETRYAVAGKPFGEGNYQIFSVAYSPNGHYIITGSSDGHIRIWDAGPVPSVSMLLEGHTGGVMSIAYSPDGRYIISGSRDKTIRMWDGETGSVVGMPLEGHTGTVCSVACSPDRRHVVSGSSDGTIRIWNVGICAPSAASRSLEGHTHQVRSVPHSPNCLNVPSASPQQIIQPSGLVPSQPSPTDNQILPNFHVRPDQDGWARDQEGGLLYWVPHDCLIVLRSSALRTIPLTGHIRSVSLNFEDFVFGTSWTDIFVGNYNAPTNLL